MTQFSTDEIETAVVDLVRQVLDDQETAIAPDAHLVDDLGVDSLSLLELVIGIEEQFGVRIADADVAHLGTVRDAVQLIAAAV